MPCSPRSTDSRISGTNPLFCRPNVNATALFPKTLGLRGSRRERLVCACFYARWGRWRAPEDEQILSFEHLPEKVLDDSWVGLAPRGFHDLANQKTRRLCVAGPDPGRDVGVG